MSRLAELEGEPVESWLPQASPPGRRARIALAPEQGGELVLEPLPDPRPQGSAPLRIRKDQRVVSIEEWAAFIRALDAISVDDAESPSYLDLVKIHVDAMSDVGMNWGVHHMGMGMHGEGRNFVVWHREYLLRMEERLRIVEPDVTIPYWNWVSDRHIPAPLSDQALLQRLGVTRYPTSDSLPTRNEVDRATTPGQPFLQFQEVLEGGPHNTVHRVVGGTSLDAAGHRLFGTMATSASPKDPVFWLHHAMIDNLWAHWEAANSGPGALPPNPTEELQPPPLITGTVQGFLGVFDLGYTYA